MVSPGRNVAQRVFGIPFDFTFDGTANATYTSKYTISTNFSFLWEIMNIYKSNASADFKINIRDEFTTEDMFVSPIYASLVSGDGQNSYILPRPYVFSAGTVITVTCTDVDGTSMTVQVALLGYKIKPR